MSRKIGKDQGSGPEDRERRGFDGLRDGVAAGYSKQAGATAPEHPAAQPQYQTIDFTPEDAQAVYRVLIAARALDGVMFTHDEWDHAMSAFGRACIVAGAKKARETT